MPGEWKDAQLYVHQPDERAFVDWIVTQHPGFYALHFHTTRTLRHEFSLPQRKHALAA